MSGGVKASVADAGITVTLTFTVDVEFAQSVFEIACYRAIDYWARGWRMVPADGTFLVHDLPDSEGGSGKRKHITPAEIVAALGRMASGGVVRDDLAEWARLALVEGDAGHVDAEVADCAVQLALFGEVVYG